MARPIRIEFAGALYHVTARGDRREAIYEDHDDRRAFLGDDAFVARSLHHARRQDDDSIPKAQRRPPPPSLDAISRKHRDRDQAIAVAHARGGYSYQRIAEYFDVHFTTVGRIVRAARKHRG